MGVRDMLGLTGPALEEDGTNTRMRVRLWRICRWLGALPLSTRVMLLVPGPRADTVPAPEDGAGIMVRTMDEGPSDEPPQRSSASAAICLIDPDALMTGADLAWLEKAAARAAEHMGLRGEVRVRLLDDRAMSEAHHRSMGESGPTDVLTFDLDPGADRLDVDLLVCVDEAARRAGEFGHGVGREILLYIVHGVLHCLGHDDHDDERARRMHEEEDRILGAIGVGAVFAPPMRCHEEPR